MITWLADYPKSGIGWIRHFLDAYLYGDVAFPKSRMRLNDAEKYMWQNVSPTPLHDLSAADAAFLRPAVLMHLLATTEEPRMVKTHWMRGVINGIPSFPLALSRKAVYILRDPRDIVCSYAHYVKEPVDDMIEGLGKPNNVRRKHLGLYHILGSWPEHVKSWTENVPFPVHVMRYEDLHRDTVGEFRKMLEFLNDDSIPVDESRLAIAVGRTQFDRLKQREQEEGSDEAPEDGNGYFRQGQVGGWRNELTDEQIARVEAICGPVMVKFRYSLHCKTAVAAAE